MFTAGVALVREDGDGRLPSGELEAIGGRQKSASTLNRPEQGFSGQIREVMPMAARESRHPSPPLVQACVSRA